ncbi:3-hydroxybutyryl-CoA dehydrogenase [Streptomyces sp. NBC_00687]|uniref:3-hydroxybutyryl-CoA dehydrogenase n=1 Tax=Streptomyces sp. NBC_00687 TaxID=2975807 RepID=UPI002255A01C|nr:3-hydroxybutyryl-CoA dehydrogenase [Streptomyces sp. NBC_00687]MCX4919024.1 3-hydroxybutyryl-CoA dehydrogenase [Streptomyces sp. NBC_00687]
MTTTTTGATPAIERVGVVGCGLMGSGIAEICARRGLDTLVFEVDEETLEAGRARIEDSLGRAVARGKLSSPERDEALLGLRFTTNLADFADRDLTIEAVPEVEELKTRLFAELDGVMRRPDALFASNTSSIPVMQLAAATSRPGQVVGLHFFNPVPVLDLVELIPTLATADAAWERILHFTETTLGRHVIVSQDRAGFVVNSLLIPYLLAAVRMYESGFARAVDIDQGMVRGCGHPMGPLALADHIGLDTTLSVAESLYAEFKEPLYAPPPLLSRMVQAGQLGRKCGRGFYEYAVR